MAVSRQVDGERIAMRVGMVFKRAASPAYACAIACGRPPSPDPLLLWSPPSHDPPHAAHMHAFPLVSFALPLPSVVKYSLFDRSPPHFNLIPCYIHIFTSFLNRCHILFFYLCLMIYYIQNISSNMHN
jgi:hypothetical protein